MRIAKASSDLDVQNVLNIVRRYIGDSAKIDADMSYEFIINLGFPQIDKMVELFKYLEEHKVHQSRTHHSPTYEYIQSYIIIFNTKILSKLLKTEMNIASLGVSVTTMEDVFLKVGGLASNSHNLTRSQGQSNLTNATDDNKQDGDSRTTLNGDLEAQKQSRVEEFPQYSEVTGIRLHFNQFYALLMKRHDAAKRQWWMLMFMVLLPVFITMLFCLADSRLTTKSANVKQVRGCTKRLMR